jgi:hypothetical protein
MQSVPITMNVVSSNLANGEVYSIQHYVIKFVRDLIFYFFHFADFSLTNWGSTRDLDLTSLIDLYIHKFYDDADIGWYLQFPSCDRNDSPFGPSVVNWIYNYLCNQCLSP